MLFIYLALLGYFFIALSFIVDKYLITNSIPQPVAYAFWVSILSVAAVILIPFGVTFIGLTDLLWSLISGAAFFGALIFFYTAVKHGEVSVSATTTGVFTVLSSYFFSFLILKERLSGINLYAFLLLAVGIACLGFAGRRILIFALPAGICFALSLVIVKLMFNHLGFVNGLFWTRMGFVASAIAPFLISSSIRGKIKESFSRAVPKSRAILVLNKGLVGVGFVLLYVAIRLGDVVVVNALQGLQFMFVLLLTLAARRWFPVFEHESDRVITAGKIAGILLIVCGFLLFIFRQ